MAGATVMFTTHHSAKRLTLETAAAATPQGKQRTVDAAARPHSQIVMDH
jgi:hypothetical protein